MNLPSLDEAVQAALQAINGQDEIVRVEFGFQANGVKFQATLDGTIKHVTRRDPTGKDEFQFRYYDADGFRVYTAEQHREHEKALQDLQDRRQRAIEDATAMLPATMAELVMELIPTHSMDCVRYAVSTFVVQGYSASGGEIYGVPNAS